MTTHPLAFSAQPPWPTNATLFWTGPHECLATSRYNGNTTSGGGGGELLTICVSYRVTFLIFTWSPHISINTAKETGLGPPRESNFYSISIYSKYMPGTLLMEPFSCVASRLTCRTNTPIRNVIRIIAAVWNSEGLREGTLHSDRLRGDPGNYHASGAQTIAWISVFR
jgi:hypothetical protein